MHTGLAKVAVQYSADTFVVNQSLVSFINKSGTAIVVADVYKVFIDEDGKTLEQLK
jgi:hypothetical protein